MNNEKVPGVSEEFMSNKDKYDNAMFGDVTNKVKELMKNNMKLPLKDKGEPNRDKEHLEFIYARLAHVYHENENIDFMIKFKQIIDSYDR
jgi:hypothetical protein